MQRHKEKEEDKKKVYTTLKLLATPSRAFASTANGSGLRRELTLRLPSFIKSLSSFLGTLGIMTPKLSFGVVQYSRAQGPTWKVKVLSVQAAALLLKAARCPLTPLWGCSSQEGKQQICAFLPTSSDSRQHSFSCNSQGRGANTICKCCHAHFS